MKTITQGLFIYVCLLTIRGMSANSVLNKPENHREKKINQTMDISRVLQDSNYTKDCGKLISNPTTLLSSVTKENTDNYLCIGIMDAVDKIPKSPTYRLMDLTRFEAMIQNSSQDLNEVCSAMNTLLKSLSYNAMMSSNPNKHVLELNKNLQTKCDKICIDFSKPLNPLCSVLLWMNRVLANTTKHVTVVEDKGSLIANEMTNGEKNPDSKLRPAEGTSGDNNGNVTVQKPLTNEQYPVSPDGMQLTQTLRNVSSNVSASSNNEQIPDIDSGNDPSLDAAAKNRNEEADHVDLPPVNAHEKLQHVEDGNDRETEGNTQDGSTKVVKSGSTLNHRKDNLPQSNQAAKPPHDGEEGKPSGQSDEAIKTENEILKDNNVVPLGDPEPPQHFFTYFMGVSFICLICYIGCHKKQKIIAMIFEGRKSRGGRGRRRPNTAGYRKLDCNLEEAVTSQCNSNVTHVIY